MNITRRELKTEAQERLKPHRNQGALVTFFSFLLPGIISPSGIAPLIIDGPLSAGMATYFLRLIRGETPGVGSVFLGFSKFLRNIRVWLLRIVRVLGWSLLFVVPGIRAALRSSMVWFVLSDEPELNAREALERSAQLTKGRLGDLFVLALSFFWWVVFGVVTVGIGFLWAIPYMQTTWALVYEGMRAAEPRRPPVPPRTE